MNPIKITTTLCAAIVALHGSAFAGGEGWTTDFAAAKKQAAESKKDLLIDFTGSDWCGWCIKLNEEVFSKAPFKAGTKDKFVLVEIDFPQKKQLAPELMKQNEELQKQMQIEGFPTIMLCDATGKPYAKTGYQPDGPEAYVKSLDELREVRVKRDASFAAAEKTTNDSEKAKLLVAGLKAMDDEVVDANYGDVIEKIGQLDKEDKTGFMKARKEAMAKKEAEEQAEKKAQGAIQEFMGSKIQPLMQAKEFDKALAEVKTYIKENPDTPEDFKVGMLMNIGLEGPMTKGDSAAAMAVVDDIAKAYPESDIAKNADKIKDSIKAKIDSMPKAEDKPKGEAKPEAKEEEK